MLVESKIVPIDEIRENTYNPNVMRDSVYQFLKRSIKKRGFVQPIIVTKDGVIIDGEHRYKACKELGMPEVEVKVLNLTEEEAKSETLNFNLTKGTFDIDLLGRLLMELDSTWGKEVLKENLVMEQKQIDAAIRAHQQDVISPTEMPLSTGVLSSSIKVNTGDIFTLAGHRLMCGDSTSSSDVEALMDGAVADITLTDPPYNVGYEYKDDKDDKSDEDYKFFIYEYINNALKVSPFLIITPGAGNEKYYYNQFDILASAFWYKGFALTHSPISRCLVTEPILFMGEKPKNKLLDTNHLDYHTDREVGLRDAHSCPKPVGLFKELVTTFTDLNGTVYDAFGGSGTTMIVCEGLNRSCYMMEQDPTYCANIITRMSQIGVRAEKI